jgi:elongation factor Ts
MEITAAMVKELRDRTGAGMMMCKKALAEADGDVEKATEELRKAGLASVAKRSDRATAEGRVEAYVHPGNRIGVLVELNCETDFVARTDDFVHLCREIALQVAATEPRFITEEEVPSEVIEEQKREAKARLSDQGFDGPQLEERLTKELDAFLDEQVLLKQPHIRDGSKTVDDLVNDARAKLGENIKVRRFSYFRLGAGH